MRRCPAGAAGAALALVLAAGCKEPAPAPAPSASAAPPISAPPPPPAPSVEKPAAKSAASGKWSGSYEAQRYLIEVPKNEGAREWAADDGGAHSGRGSISLEVGETGAIVGSASGPLGEQKIVGEVDGDSFRVRFVPVQPGDRAFVGFTVLRREGEAMKGRLQASTGDSKTVRDALISLSRGDSAPAPSAAPSSSG